jgi:hypothetical protein
MNRSKIKIVAGMVVLGCFSTALVLEHQANHRLGEENARLREAGTQLDALREENARLAKLDADAAELSRLRQGQDEILRLRGELSRLRKQVAERQVTQASLSASPTTAAEPTSPVQAYSAVLSAQIPTGQTLLTGGWRTAEGKRTFVLITPNALDYAAQIN